jgi:Uma2 family endonuclease
MSLSHSCLIKKGCVMNESMLEQEELLEASGEAQAPDQNGVEEDVIEERPERNMGARASQVAANVISYLKQHASERKLGKVFNSECGYHLPGVMPKKVRFPDASFLARGRLPEDRTPEGNLKLAPDLAVEVVSPNDKAYEVEEKRAVYLAAGVRLVWVVYPPTRTVFVFHRSGVTVLGESDTLTGADVLPEFSCPVARFFEDL